MRWWVCGVMILVMAREKSVSDFSTPSRNAMGDVNALMRGTDTRAGYSRADQDLANRRGGELFLSPMSTLVNEAKNTGAVRRGTPASTALSAGAFVADLLNPSFGLPIGVGGAAAAQNVGRTALGTTARTLRTNPNMSPGVRNVFELIAARHASRNPNLAKELVDPANVPVSSGRDWGPGFYYEANRPLTSTVPYPDLLAKYGDNFYMPKMSPLDMMRIARSRGMADAIQDLGINRGVNQMSSLTMDSPQIQDAMRRGFTGIEGWTNWLVGNPARVGGLPNLGVRQVTAADDATYPALEALLRKIFEK